ncbi:MAG: VWA domain-containing protein [Flavobacteriales bacterium]|nr:VWA domain-containing protein [Flavobacteriales bacterium]
MRIPTVLIFLLFFQTTYSQIVFSTSYHNLGDVNKEDKKYFDFTLTNAGKVAATIIKVEEPYGISTKFSKKTIEPDSSITVRIKYTPKRKGTFKQDVPIWVSVNNEPITLTLEGNAITFDVNEPMSPPDFYKIVDEKEERTDLKISVVDINTKKPIQNATIEIIWDGLVYKRVTSDKLGEAIQNLKLDNYYLFVTADNYVSKETDMILDFKNNTIQFELGEPTKEEILAKEEPKDTTTIVITPEPTDTISTTELPVNLFAPNNVVFLIDVSVSMKQKGRMDILKASMIELLNGLRTIDKLAIVTYATSTEVVLESDFVTDKAKITQLIQDLTAGGYTSGGKGVKKAYQVARENYLKEGNNQVIIATDGAFNIEKSDKSIVDDVAANYKKGISMSVLGVKNEKWTVPSMTAMAEAGGGSYLHIESYIQAKSVLMNEIKAKSKKK